VALALAGMCAAAPLAAQSARVTVSEGTSMALDVSPDGGRLVIDLQGTLWVLPATGGAARPITDHFHDARLPVWSPDGRTIAFQGFRAGTYDIWSVAPDGSNLRRLTTGPYDDREPAWSPDGRRIAFTSDRGGNGSYDIWTLDVQSGELARVTATPQHEAMPVWSADGREIAFSATRDGGAGTFAITLASDAERRLTTGGGAPSWSADGRLLVHAVQGGAGRLLHAGDVVTGSENVFPFRAAWTASGTFYYTADGGIRRRTPGSSAPDTIAFSAELEVVRAQYERRVRDVDSRTPRRVLGIVAPQLSPDGGSVAFTALGDVWLLRPGAAPHNLTRSASLDADPAWSPDGTRLVYASDRAGGVLNLWLHDVPTGEARQLTRLSNATVSPAWSPDGTRIAFLEVDGAWRRAAVAVVDVTTGEVTRIQASSFGPGAPTWSPDGRWVAVAALVPYSTRFREGTNQIRLIPAAGGVARWLTLPDGGLDSRAGAGPVWSPAGGSIAFVQGGLLRLLPVTPDGAVNGPVRTLTQEIAHAPSWSRDGRRILYQSNDRLRTVDPSSGAVADVPLDLTYTPVVPADRTVVHAGRLIDGVTPTAREHVDIVIDGNRIVRVAPHDDGHHAGRSVIDASGLTVMPGLIDYHTHLQHDLGEAHGRSWLAFGITTVRSPGGLPYEAVEQREAVDAGVRAGPRSFATGFLLEWQRAYYRMAVAITDDAHLERELERARALEHDLIKSYVRMPDLQQRRIVEFAHAMGVPTSSHEVYPSPLAGSDGVEHTGGTSRRGYSPKSTQSRTYADVTTIIGAAGMTLSPTLALSAAWLNRVLAIDPALRTDPRFSLLPDWLAGPIVRGTSAEGVDLRPPNAGGAGEFIMSARRAGARIAAGTDTPNPASLHGELLAYVAAGMTPFEALQTATTHAAAALGLDAGVISAGRLADLVAVDGNPLDDITHTHRVRIVIANGRAYTVESLLSGPVGAGTHVP
jgi:Tol biopolymer transport system component